MAQIASDSEVALVADGTVTLHGHGMDASSFRGLVSAGGSFVADNITVTGVFVQTGSGGQTTLQNVRVVQDSTLSVFQMGMTWGSSTWGRSAMKG